MGIYDRSIATALRLIKKYGQTVDWKSIEAGPPVDPSKPWNESDTSPVIYKPFVCFLPVDKETREFISYIRGTEITTGSTIGLMGSVNFSPKAKDVLIRPTDGREYRIKHIDELAPNGVIILYTIEFEG